MEIEDDPNFWEWLEKKYQKNPGKESFKRLVLELPILEKSFPKSSEATEDYSDIPRPLYEDQDSEDGKTNQNYVIFEL